MTAQRRKVQRARQRHLERENRKRLRAPLADVLDAVQGATADGRPITGRDIDQAWKYLKTVDPEAAVAAVVALRSDDPALKQDARRVLDTALEQIWADARAGQPVRGHKDNRGR